MSRFLLLAIALLVFRAPVLLAQAPQATGGASQVGTIEGVVIYESDRRRPWRYRRYYVADRKKGHLAEAVVSLMGLRTRKGQPATWTIDQKDYRFIPETLAVRSGDQVRFTNSDRVLHDVTIRQQGPAAGEVEDSSFSLNHRQEVMRVYDDAGGVDRPVTLSCRFHSSMRGWIYVFEHAFFEVTGEDGKFRIERVPAGKHQLLLVHPAGNLWWSGSVEVKPGKTQQIEIRVSPDQLRSKKK